MVKKMSSEVLCPHCAQPIDPQTRFCERCGVDLAFAVAVAERSLTGGEIPSGVPLAPEVLVPRMGEAMIEQGLITPAELQKALEYQEKKAAEGHPLLIGRALLELGLIEQTTLDQAITQRIMQLHQALRDANRQLEQRVEERTRDLQYALERLAELNQLKANFVANISHELRTPLTHIKGYLDLLSEGALGPLTPQQTDALAVLLRAEARLEQLIENLIQFSLASKGEFSLELTSVCLENLVSPVIERFRTQAETKQIELMASLPPELPMVQADPDKISWVVSQLLDNAIKFTQPGGQVRVTAVEDTGRVFLSVSDTGIGIPQEQIGEIFDAFHQLDGSTTRRYGGTGLGLAMVRRIVDAHGSQIQVESVVGQGSRFEFSLLVTQKNGHPSGLEPS